MIPMPMAVRSSQTKVYIVTESDVEHHAVIAVYRCRENAEEHIIHLQKHDRRYGRGRAWLEVEVFDVKDAD